MSSTGLSIVVRLRDGRYDAGGLDPSLPEWPPHPARLFCGLLAGASDDSDRHALSWLESQGAPEILASEQVTWSRASGYVVTNKLGGSGSQTWPARTNGLRNRVSAFPADDTYAVVWPDAQPDDVVLARLARLASRLPYVGRSTSHAEVAVTPTAIPIRPGWSRYRPVPLGTPGTTAVRVPFPGYLRALMTAYDEDVRSWQVSAQSLVYSSRSDDPEDVAAADAVDSPFADLLVWGFARPTVPVPGDRALLVADCLRKAVLRRVPDPLPPQVSGHGAPGRQHVAFVSLLDVAHDKADGHILGVAVAVPSAIAPSERKVILRGLLGGSPTETMAELTTWRGRAVALEYSPDGVWGLRPRRWQRPEGSRSWVTATPVMLDRFPRQRDDASAADVVAKALVTAGYPAPSSVEVLRGPAVVGGVHWLRFDGLGSRPRRPMRHCRIVFDRPQRGPVLVGATRYLGGGLFVPEEDANAGA